MAAGRRPTGNEIVGPDASPLRQTRAPASDPPETPYIPRAECAKRAMTRIACITAPTRRSPAKVKHASPFGKGGLGDRRLFRLSPKRLDHFANSELDSDSCLWISVTGRRSPMLKKNLFFIFRGQSSEQFGDDVASIRPVLLHCQAKHVRRIDAQRL